MAEVLHMYPIPPVGAEGVYSLLPPFTTPAKERFRCIGVRRISEYVANNEDPFADVYQPVGLSSSVFDEDAKSDMEIITLLSDRGLRILVPAHRIESYPAQDGISYVRMGVTITFPALPMAEAGLGPLQTRLKDVVTSTLGFDNVIVKPFVRKGVAKIPETDHDTIQTARDVIIAGRTTDYARVVELEAALVEANGKIAQLEAYILANQPPP